MTLPDAVTAAARKRHLKGSPLPAASQIVQRGDLRLIKPPYDAVGEPRLGLVLSVDTELGFVEFALVHPYADLATTADGIVPGAIAGTPYDVVVQTDLRGVAWTPVQVGGLVGRLPETILDEISDLVGAGKPESLTRVRIGTSLTGSNDRRWSFKADEGSALDLLTSDCTGEVIHSRSPWALDRNLLVPALLASGADPNAVVLELEHWIETRDIRLSIDDALELEDRGFLDIEVWAEAGLDLKIYEMVLELVEDALTSSGVDQAEVASRMAIAPYSDPGSFEEADSIHVFGTLVGSNR